VSDFKIRKKANVMMNAGITFQRSLALRDAAFARIPKAPRITKALTIHFGLTALP
jgi:hypothetical protein